MAMNVRQSVTAMIKACMFSAMKIVYAEIASASGEEEKSEVRTCNKADLGDSDGGEDCESHRFAIKDSAHVCDRRCCQP